MTQELYEACKKMCNILGYGSWDQQNYSVRSEVMKLVLLQIIATQLEEIDRTLGSSR